MSGGDRFYAPTGLRAPRVTPETNVTGPAPLETAQAVARSFERGRPAMGPAVRFGEGALFFYNRESNQP